MNVHRNLTHCRCTASIGQAADSSEAAAVDHHFRRQLKTFRSSLSTDTGIQTDDCFVMHPQSPSRERNTFLTLLLLLKA